MREPLRGTSLDAPFVPQPNARGIERVQALYRERTGNELSEADARKLLGTVINYLWALHYPGPDSPHGQENDGNAEESNA